MTWSIGFAKAFSIFADVEAPIRGRGAVEMSPERWDTDAGKLTSKCTTEIETNNAGKECLKTLNVHKHEKKEKQKASRQMCTLRKRGKVSSKNVAAAS
jgi:hypothetical protein